MSTRRALPSKIDEIPGRYDVCDGGIYIRIGDEEIAITPSRMDDEDRVHESVLRAKTVVQNLVDQGAEALRELDAMLVALGFVCGTCQGAKGQVVAGPQGWVDCVACEGKGRVPDTDSGTAAA